MLALGAILFIAVIVSIVTALEPEGYLCSICVTSVDKLRATSLLTLYEKSVYDGCVLQFSAYVCDVYFPNNHALRTKSMKYAEEEITGRDLCVELGVCPANEAWMNFAFDPNELDIRVSKALGSRGYDKVRISVISNKTISSNVFSYNSQFKYKWTDKYLSSGVVSVTPGKTTRIAITGDKYVDVNIPVEGAGTRGVIIADPCFSSQYVSCKYKDTFQMFNHMTELLNAINAHDDVSFWQILGDNFYDQVGQITSTFFQALSQQSKSKVFQTVPGNHDYWVHGAPYVHVPADQLGNGFMQFYGQDVLASSADASKPYDFSTNPDKSTVFSSALPSASNFFFYNKVGNIGFMGYSGAYKYEDQKDYFNEACTWAESADLDVFLLLGHWNSDGMGCDADATVPSLYTELAALPSCQKVASKMKYFMGHKHCNQVTLADDGFMVGAQGMSDSSCDGEFGIPVVDTTNKTFKLYYFQIAVDGKVDNYDKILSCIKANGVSGCYSLATLWASVPL